jgi:uncharacterized membrane protein
VAAIVAGGVAGLFVDSLVGATIQERRWKNNAPERPNAAHRAVQNGTSG